ncbi:MAG: hypothetical protein ACI915_003566 [Gammaproteobacteria bacterium]|jgi:hypothetical protein
MPNSATATVSKTPDRIASSSMHAYGCDNHAEATINRANFIPHVGTDLADTEKLGYRRRACEYDNTHH